MGVAVAPRRAENHVIVGIYPLGDIGVGPLAVAQLLIWLQGSVNLVLDMQGENGTVVGPPEDDHKVRFAGHIASGREYILNDGRRAFEGQ